MFSKDICILLINKRLSSLSFISNLKNIYRTSNQYTQSQTITVHKKYVNAVVVVYTLTEYPNGLIITGSNDQTISVHDIESNADIAQFKEHDGAGK